LALVKGRARESNGVAAERAERLTPQSIRRFHHAIAGLKEAVQGCLALLKVWQPSFSGVRQ